MIKKLNENFHPLAFKGLNDVHITHRHQLSYRQVHNQTSPLCASKSIIFYVHALNESQ